MSGVMRAAAELTVTGGHLLFSACSPVLVGELLRMFVKKPRAREPWGAGVPSCSRWEDKASHIPVASALGIGG